MPEEADHLGVGGGAHKGHVTVSEGAVDLQMEAGFGRWISVLSEGLHPVSRQVEVEAVGTDLRCGYLKKGEARTDQRSNHFRYHKIYKEVNVIFVDMKNTSHYCLSIHAPCYVNVVKTLQHYSYLPVGIYSFEWRVRIAFYLVLHSGKDAPFSLKPEWIHFIFNDISQQSGIKQHLSQPREIVREQEATGRGWEQWWGRAGHMLRAKFNPYRKQPGGKGANKRQPHTENVI